MLEFGRCEKNDMYYVLFVFLVTLAAYEMLTVLLNDH